MSVSWPAGHAGIRREPDADSEPSNLLLTGLDDRQQARADHGLRLVWLSSGGFRARDICARNPSRSAAVGIALTCPAGMQLASGVIGVSPSRSSSCLPECRAMYVNKLALLASGDG